MGAEGGGGACPARDDSNEEDDGKDKRPLHTARGRFAAGSITCPLVRRSRDRSATAIRAHVLASLSHSSSDGAPCVRAGDAFLRPFTTFRRGRPRLVSGDAITLDGQGAQTGPSGSSARTFRRLRGRRWNAAGKVLVHRTSRSDIRWRIHLEPRRRLWPRTKLRQPRAVGDVCVWRAGARW